MLVIFLLWWFVFVIMFKVNGIGELEIGWKVGFVVMNGCLEWIV